MPAEMGHMITQMDSMMLMLDKKEVLMVRSLILSSLIDACLHRNSYESCYYGAMAVELCFILHCYFCLILGNMQLLVEWLKHMLPDLDLPLEASEEDLRACLIDGTVLCSLLNKLRPGLIEMVV